LFLFCFCFWFLFLVFIFVFVFFFVFSNLLWFHIKFLYSYESEILQKLVKDKKIHEARSLISHTGILMTFYLSIILDLQSFFH
jgi:hypothetical protein